MRNKFNSLFSIKYFTSMKTTGKTEIYHKIKKHVNLKSIWIQIFHQIQIFQI